MTMRYGLHVTFGWVGTVGVGYTAIFTACRLPSQWPYSRHHSDTVEYRPNMFVYPSFRLKDTDHIGGFACSRVAFVKCIFFFSKAPLSLRMRHNYYFKIHGQASCFLVRITFKLRWMLRKKTGLTLFDFSESLTFEVSLEYLTSSFGWPKYLWVTMRICFSRTPGDPKIVNGYKERL